MIKYIFIFLALFSIVMTLPARADGDVGGRFCSNETLGNSRDTANNLRADMERLREERRKLNQALRVNFSERKGRLYETIFEVVFGWLEPDDFIGGALNSAMEKANEHSKLGVEGDNTREDREMLTQSIQSANTQWVREKKWQENCDSFLNDEETDQGLNNPDETPDFKHEPEAGGGGCVIVDACVFPGGPRDEEPIPEGEVTVDDGVSDEELCRLYGINCN